MKFQDGTFKAGSQDSCLKRVTSGDQSFDELINAVENSSFDDFAKWVVTQSKTHNSKKVED